MHARTLAIAASALLFGAAAQAEPTPAKKAEPAAQAPRDAKPTVLASAEAITLPAAVKEQGPAAPARRRNARVTTCRCGDPAPQR